MSSTLRMPSRPLVRRAAAVGALSAAALLAAAGAASAHVTVQPSTAAKGAADQTFSFRVPNEQDGASTTKVQVYFPADHPIPSVLVAQVPGWTATVQTTKLSKPIQTDDGQVTDAVSEITWSGGAIRPGQYQDFTVDLGQLPSDTDALTFKALQTYSNGQVVRWIEEQQPGQPEPENPAPVLKLTAPAGTTASATAPAREAAAPAGGSSSDGTARALGITGIVVGAAGVVTGVLGRRRRGGSPAA